MRSKLSKIVAYHSHSRNEERSLLQKSSIKLNSSVLDAGCGDGDFFVSCFGFVKDSVGVDIDYSKVNKAAGKYCKVYCADIRKLPFHTNEFDSILCNSVLEHIEHIDVAIKELCRVSRKIFITVPKDIHNKAEKRLSIVLFNHVNLLDKQQWITMFKTHGFELEHSTHYNDTRVHNLYIISCVLIFLIPFSTLFIRALSRLQSRSTTSLFMVFNKQESCLNEYTLQ